MWTIIQRGLAWFFRGSDSSAREHFDAVATTNRADFASVVAEWKALAIDLRKEITELELRLDATEEREKACIKKQFEQDARIMRLEWIIKRHSDPDIEMMKDQ